MVAILTTFIAFLARLALAFVVVVVGIYLANFASKLILATRLKQKQVLALLARLAIIVFAVAMALDQMGIANDVVNLTFGLILAGGALGGRPRLRPGRHGRGQVPVGALVSERRSQPGRGRSPASARTQRPAPTCRSGFAGPTCQRDCRMTPAGRKCSAGEP